MVRVKVCGMRCRDDVDVCVAAGVDAVGFIFAAGPRGLALDEAAALTKRLPPFVTSVGVFAGNEEAFVWEALRGCRLDVLQFSGGESPRFCGAFGKPTMIVVHVEPSALRTGHAPQMPDAEALATACAVALMADSRSEAKAGGTGVRIDDATAAALARASSLPFILAGGLTPENVSAAIAAVRPWGVDVRSGVERMGRKDENLVTAFVREARRSSLVSRTPEETWL